MLRQPQLHGYIPRAHVHVCVPHYLLESHSTHTHMLTRTCTTHAVAMGDRGGSARVWHAPSQVARENDGSWQLTVWPPPPPPLPLAIRLVLPAPPSLPSLHVFTLSLSLYLYLSFPFFLTLSHACWLWANNSTSTCLDRFTFLKMTMSVASYPALDVFFIWVPHCDDVVLWMFYRGVFLNPDRQTLSFFLIFFKGKENEVQESANQLLNNICFLGQK